MLFIAILLTANHMAVKLVSIFGFTIGAGVMVFPQSYILANITTEVYGYKNVRYITWASIVIVLFVIFWREISVIMHLDVPLDEGIENKQAAYNLVTSISEGTNRALASSVLSYGVSELINSMFVSKLKIMFRGKFFWLRASFSTLVALLIGTIIYNLGMFTGIVDYSLMLKMSLFSIAFTLALEQMLMPLSISIIKFLKNKEKIDVYDLYTSYNPFSLDTQYTKEEVSGEIIRPFYKKHDIQQEY